MWNSNTSYPKAILHIDGDCFFVSCEVAKNPKLKGKVVVTGMERGIVSALSYEAKARGVKRGMSLFEVRKICPDVILIPSDYETYSLYSMRMYNIVRRYTGDVEEYSIDECFADLTGMRRPLKMSYEQIGSKIKDELNHELGMTFSIGLAPNKVLAKVASKWQKPSGFTAISIPNIKKYLQNLPIENIWGIGPQTTAYLNKFGIRMAGQFADKKEGWILDKLTKPHFEIWQELNGKTVYDLNRDIKNNYKSISKTKTFTPASSEKSFVYSQLSKNVENACIKARRHKLATKKIFYYLKTQEFKHFGAELCFSETTNIAADIISEIKKSFDNVYDGKKQYRATGVVLIDLEEEGIAQMELFRNSVRTEKMTKLFLALDEMAMRYGKHTLFLGSSLNAMTGAQHISKRKIKAKRKTDLFKGETTRKRLGLPMLGEVF